MVPNLLINLLGAVLLFVTLVRAQAGFTSGEPEGPNYINTNTDVVTITKLTTTIINETFTSTVTVDLCNARAATIV